MQHPWRYSIMLWLYLVSLGCGSLTMSRGVWLSVWSGPLLPRPPPLPPSTRLTLTCVVFHHVVVVSVRRRVVRQVVLHHGRVVPPREQVSELRVHGVPTNSVAVSGRKVLFLLPLLKTRLFRGCCWTRTTCFCCYSWMLRQEKRPDQCWRRRP